MVTQQFTEHFGVSTAFSSPATVSHPVTWGMQPSKWLNCYFPHTPLLPNATSLPLLYSGGHSLMHSLTHSLTHSHKYSLTHTHTHTHTHKHAHTHAHSLTHSLTHIHTHTPPLRPSHTPGVDSLLPPRRRTSMVRLPCCRASSMLAPHSS